MKKTNFLKSIAAFVMAGCMFTSCEKEDLNATFWAGPAEVTLEVEVFDALTGTDVTSQAEITLSTKMFTVNGTSEFKYGIKEAQTITITATLGEGTATSDVVINPIKTSGKAKYYVKLIISDGLKFTTTTLGTSDKEVRALFQNLSHDADYTYEGITGWYSNATEYFQPFSVDYEIVEASYNNFSELSTENVYNDMLPVNQEAIQTAYDNMKSTQKTSEKTTYKGKASAWSYFNVFVTVTTTNYKWTATTANSAEEVASFTYEGISSTAAEYVEIAHPNHAGHHIYGHGHGDANNAGGGISIAE